MHVLVAMSGGVDSSVAALRLLRAGHEVTGVFLRNGVSRGEANGNVAERPRPRQGCCSVRDANDAEEVAGILGIPFYSLDHEREFRRIVEAFVEDHSKGLTPNPCMLCNRDLKFGELWGFARSVGAEAIATGHYAQIQRTSSTSFELRRAVDRDKDQSYVLALVDPGALLHSVFPVGDSVKREIRAEARAAGLPIHSKSDSQDICFVPTGDHKDVLRRERPELFRPGTLESTDGRVLGHHDGAASFTVGQRRGLGVAKGGPWYVVRTEPAENRVVLGTLDEARTDRSILAEMVWFDAKTAPSQQGDTEWEGTVQVRAHHPGVPASVRQRDRDAYEVTFAEPLIATPGQYGVLYDGDRVVASGRFRSAESESPSDPR